MAFRSFNKLTNAFLGEIPFDSRAILKTKIRDIYIARKKLNISPHERLNLLQKMSGYI